LVIDGLVQVARSHIRNEEEVKTIALCAGSGSSVFKEIKRPVDVLLTGELSHHEVLAAVANRTNVILCGHSNTERGFLRIMKNDLQRELDQEVGESKVEVFISTKDCDPIEIL
jgi:putative NIF3 family GTP cyclohydrolase 1 type 2